MGEFLENYKKNLCGEFSSFKNSYKNGFEEDKSWITKHPYLIAFILLILIGLAWNNSHENINSNKESSTGEKYIEVISIPDTPKYSLKECKRLCFEVIKYIDHYYSSAEKINDIENGLYDFELNNCLDYLGSTQFTNDCKEAIENYGSDWNKTNFGIF